MPPRASGTSGAESLNVSPHWRVTRMRSSAWRGHPPGTYSPPAAETRAYGYGKVILV